MNAPTNRAATNLTTAALACARAHAETAKLLASLGDYAGARVADMARLDALQVAADALLAEVAS